MITMSMMMIIIVRKIDKLLLIVCCVSYERYLLHCAWKSAHHKLPKTQNII